MRRKMKRFFAALMAGALICSNLPMNAIAIEVNAAEENQIEAQETLGVSFDSQYAQVGKALSVTVTGATNASYQWYVGGKRISNSTNSYTPTATDLEKWIEVVVTSGTEQVSTKLYCSKLPVVYINTENGAAITSKEDYINATMTIQGNETYNSETSTLYDGDIEIRGRGNSTWSKPKKPYKIKLDKKTSVFGMGKNKHWVLLANYLDESLMRNTLAYDLSGSMEMEQMSTVWVDVVMNGEYVGNYQFCEQVRVDETRVQVFDWEGFAEDSGAVIAEVEGVDEDDLAEYMLENMDWITSGKVTFNGKTYNISDYPDIEIPSIDGGYILELDEYYDEVSKFKTDNNQPIMFKNPEFVNTNSEMMAYVRNYVQAFEDAVMDSDYATTYEGKEVHYSELYDFDALVDYWLISEIFYNEEFNKKSTYMYKEIGELVKMGPIWDMDWSSGAGETKTGATNQWATNYFSVNAQAQQWYKYLVQDPYFLMKAQERYWEIRGAQVQDMLDSIDGHYEYLKESGAADGVRWGGRVSFNNDVNNLKNWLNTHIAWMDQQMATEDSLSGSFYMSQSGLQLALRDSNGNALGKDNAKNAPADGVVNKGTDLKLAVTGSSNIRGTAQVYVNGQKHSTVTVNNTTANVVISSDALTAETGEKNTIEVKVADNWGSVIAANYVTVKEGVKKEAMEVSFNNTYAKVGEALSVTEAAGATYEWYVDGKRVSSGSNSYIPRESDLEKWIEVVVSTETKEGTAKLYCSKLPVMYIDTENGAEIVSKEDYIDATIRIQGNETYNSETTTLYDGATEIRGRGNSTWSQPKKPYKLKLDKKTDVFGMGKNKHWVLLANYLDESLMRNTLAYDLSGSMDMEQMSTVWVDVIMNGEYVGNYQFCEQVRVDDTRVQVFDWEGFAEDSGAVIAEVEGVDEDDLAEYMLENMGWITSGRVTFNGKTYNISDYPDIEIPSIDGGYILELDEYYDEVSKFTTNSGQPIMFKNPEFVNTNSEMMEYVQTYVQAFEDAVMSSNYTAVYDGEQVHYSELYDFDALVDYWLISEIFYNEEFNKKSTYMYKEIGELMKMGPIWDMDWSSGAAGTSAGATNQWATNYFSVNAQKSQWYKYLVQDPYFLMKAQERYWEIRGAQVQDMLDSIDVHHEYLRESGAADTARWGGRVPFDSDVNNLKNWLNTHIAWMDRQMTTEDLLDASFYKNENGLQLVLTDSDGNALMRDGAAKAAADHMIEEGTGLELTITAGANVRGTAEIYINSQKYTTATVGTSSAEVVIPAEALAEVDGKNTIEVKLLTGTGDVLAANYITIREYAIGEMPEEPEEPEIPVDPSDDSRDYDVSKLVYKSGSNSAAGEGIELAFDGNESTIWHTEYRPAWYGNENCENYLWIELELEENTVVDAIRYLPRQDNTVNGNILAYRVEGTVDGGNWVTLTTGIWTFEDRDWKVAEFDAIELAGLRLVATSSDSASDKDRYISAAELRVRTAEIADEPDKPDVPDKPSDPSDDSKDYDVTKIVYTTGSEQEVSGEEGPIGYAFDDVESTHWHSEWKPEWYGKEDCKNYLWVQFEFKELIVADAIRYLPRQDKSTNGDIASYRVEGTADGRTWIPLAEGTWSTAGKEKVWRLAEFEATEVVALRLVATSTVSDSDPNKFASAAELRVRTAEIPETPDVPTVDKTALIEAIEAAEELSENNYTADSWTVFVAAIVAAKAVNANENATEADVREALADLAAAQDGLERKPVVTPFDKTALAEAIAAAEKLSANDYTADSWTVFSAAIVAARVVYANESATEAEIRTALADLAATQDALVRKPAKPVNLFEDVFKADYYYEPVTWAVENGITDGWTPTLFAPEMGCTRGQVVTFLWRAAGEPKVKNTENPFADVTGDAYYYDAVLWAVEKGITDGWTPTLFAPDMTCTRGQIVTFIWRAAGEPEVTAENPFTDVAENAYYYDAVLWAVENGITDGWTATTFAPDMTCTRGQVVTFLYRHYND